MANYRFHVPKIRHKARLLDDVIGSGGGLLGTDNSAVTSAATVFLDGVKAIICNIEHPKAQIHTFLSTCKKSIDVKADLIIGLCETTNESNAESVGTQLAVNLNAILTLLQVQVANIQRCGTDPSPLKVDLSVSLSDVSYSAFQLVLSLKPVFETATELTDKFPVIDKSCGSILIKLSTELANLVGACSEQVNLFDAGFFALAGPQMKDFNSVGGRFASFSGSFI
ncbi:hypothetical protein CROQUDRAFT_96746 [Cronartium quercuum f. sp. fusiforme G11]|uniref:Uncharacterized protein n=1 Tax=Cronartium quercuum f. sp. fusiforme G11 TaxID=708437 RepID=A0A9P6T9Y7_9BASI|nr:hypothetical protein CROQUDRAFT_96746 [Cronartium quercuum f. sp. fusiforme G11]